MEDNSTSPITHSMQQDSIKSAQKIVGSDNVPSDEALMLAHMRERSMKKRRLNILGIFGFVFLLFGLSAFLLPDSFFKPKSDVLTVNNVNKKIIPIDKSYGVNLPNESELNDFRQKSLSGVIGISEILIAKNGVRLKFSELSPLVNNRFISGLASAEITDYVYGLYTKENEKSVPLLLLVTNNRLVSETELLNLERTMYTDLSDVLRIPKNVENETRRFETFTSVRSPFRELRDANAETVMVYGFPMDNIIVFTSSRDAYNGVRARLLTGY